MKFRVFLLIYLLFCGSNIDAQYWNGRPRKLYDTVRVVFIGDVMQHGNQIRSAHTPGTDPAKASSYDYSHAFKYFKERFKAADIAVANMEFPVGLPPYSGYPQFSAPEAIAYEAAESGISLFAIANNHLADKGHDGIVRTIAVYDSLAAHYNSRTYAIESSAKFNYTRTYANCHTAGFHYTGAYANDSLERANNPKIIDLNGIKIAFINFTYGTNGYPVPAPFVVNRMDSTKVKEVISRARERGAELIVALPHWGNEYELYPSAKQKAWTKMLFNNGVRVIIGSHPHVPQTAEIHLSKSLQPRQYGKIDKMVFYSLGNYISNQSIPDWSQLGMLVEIEIIKERQSGEITLSGAEYEYIWCFKKDEFAPDYTVVPVKDFIDKPELVKDKSQYLRMKNTYNLIMQKQLVKEIF